MTTSHFKAARAAQIQAIFTSKAFVTFDERRQLAEIAYGALDGMKTNPTQGGYVDLIDITNVLATLVLQTATRKNRRALKAPDVQQWLFEHGHSLPMTTINATQENLKKIGERQRRTGSWAMDADTFTLLEKVITMYQEAISEIPWKLVLYHKAGRYEN